MTKSIRTIHISIVCLSLMLMSYAGLCKASVNEYRITVDQENLRKIKVEANLILGGSVLSMDWPSGNSVENSWAHFVEILDITDKSGKSVPYQAHARASWSLPNELDEVRINYVVNLTHDYVKWQEGVRKPCKSRSGIVERRDHKSGDFYFSIF